VKPDLLSVAARPDIAQRVAEFVKFERAVGGPDPHMATVGHMSAGLSLEERLWRAGCYVGVYNVPTAERLWEAWPWPRIVFEGPYLEPWLAMMWGGIVTRRERRAVRTPWQLGHYLMDYAEMASKIVSGQVDISTYERAWTAANGVYGLGRYAALKLLEFWRRYCDQPQLAIDDIRPAGGWSPRQGLALVFPQHAPALLGDDRPAHLATANRLAGIFRENLADWGVELDWYNTQVLLCDVKQALVGQRQYPGRSLDSEIEYHDAIADFWQMPTAMWASRAALFPERALGEVQGWRHVRKELGRVVWQHGYTWTDTRYDFLATSDLARPVRWQ
jgi:hypothetical protein